MVGVIEPLIAEKKQDISYGFSKHISEVTASLLHQKEIRAELEKGQATTDIFSLKIASDEYWMACVMVNDVVSVKFGAIPPKSGYGEQEAKPVVDFELMCKNFKNNDKDEYEIVLARGKEETQEISLYAINNFRDAVDAIGRESQYKKNVGILMTPIKVL